MTNKLSREDINIHRDREQTSDSLTQQRSCPAGREPKCHPAFGPDCALIALSHFPSWGGGSRRDTCAFDITRRQLVSAATTGSETQFCTQLYTFRCRKQEVKGSAGCEAWEGRERTERRLVTRVIGVTPTLNHGTLIFSLTKQGKTNHARRCALLESFFFFFFNGMYISEVWK